MKAIYYASFLALALVACQQGKDATQKPQQDSTIHTLAPHPTLSADEQTPSKITPARDSQDQEMKEAYAEEIRQMNNGRGEYLNEYFLHDISGDQKPELFVLTGTSEDDRVLDVFRHSGDSLHTLLHTTADHSEFFAGNNYVLQVWANKGEAKWTKLRYRNGKVVQQQVYAETDDPENDNESTSYKSPREEFVPTSSCQDISLLNDGI